MYVRVSVKIEMYVYEIGPRYFYHATTSPEMWTHIFLNYHHSFTSSFFFFLKLLIIHPKEYSFHFFQHRQKLFHFSLLFNFFYYIILKDG